MYARKYALPTEQESQIARQARAKIIPFVQEDAPATLHINGASRDESIELPAGTLEFLKEILEALAAGHGVTIVPQHAVLTTRQAAEILNFSRPHLIKLLNAGEIPFHKVGSHHRIRREDVMRYKQKFDEERDAFLTWLVAESEELGLYD